MKKVLEEGQAGEDPALATKEPADSSKSPAPQEETTETAAREGLQTTTDEADSNVAGPSAVIAAENEDLALTSRLHGKKRRHSPSSGGFKRRKTDDALIGDQIRAPNQQTQDGERKRPSIRQCWKRSQIDLFQQTTNTEVTTRMQNPGKFLTTYHQPKMLI